MVEAWCIRPTSAALLTIMVTALQLTTRETFTSPAQRPLQIIRQLQGSYSPPRVAAQTHLSPNSTLPERHFSTPLFSAERAMKRDLGLRLIRSAKSLSLGLLLPAITLSRVTPCNPLWQDRLMLSLLGWTHLVIQPSSLPISAAAVLTSVSVLLSMRRPTARLLPA